MKVPARAALLAASTLLGACSVGPDYVAPTPPAPAPFRQSPAGAPGDALGERWWDLFGDPDLDGHVDAALASNQDLAAALARFDEARALLGLARAEEYPVAGAQPQLVRTRFSSTIADRYPFLNVTVYELPVSVAYEIDFWGRVRHTTAAAAAGLAASADGYAALRVSLVSEVVLDWLQLRSLDRDIDVLTRTVTLRQDALALQQRRAHAGSVGDLDVLRAQADLAQTQADLDDARRRRDLAVGALSVLEDRSATEFEIPAQLRPETVPSVPAGLPSDLLRRRPDLAARERALAAASEQIGIAVAAFYPSVALTAAGGVESGKLDKLFENQSLVWAIGPLVTLPLFDGGRNRAGFFAAQARYREALADYRKAYRVALREVQDALAEEDFLRERGVHLHEARVAAEQAAKLSRSRYDRGFVSYFEVVDSERGALGTERAEIANDQQRLGASVALIKALGGGWKPDAPVPAQPREAAPGRLPMMPTAIPPP